MYHNVVATLLFLMALSLTGFAQVSDRSDIRDVRSKKPIDDLEYRFTYRVKSSQDTSRKQAIFDNEALEVGKRYIRFYSLFAEKMDSTAYLYMSGLKKSKGDGFLLTEGLGKNERGLYEEIFINYPQHGIMSVCNGIFKKSYEYAEASCQFSWTFESGTRTVMGYECHKAVTKFRGREWTAWYAIDIPFSYGPWKFGGLPGLILAISDGDDLFSYELIGLHKAETGEKIFRYDLDYIRCNRKDILNIREMEWKDPSGLASMNGAKMDIVLEQDPKTGQLTRKKAKDYHFDYIPQMEKE
ncbi:MAG: GLPGLI family protein [Bacteroidales bacterium]|nr:GLPGLI family protein [Bacteroidales bacterium]MDY6002691.1 GLPGLI family protein [Candidatus Cryptobacteroides sp.]